MNQLLRRKKGQLANNKKKGFTLVELIIVIAIIAILAAMAIPKLSAVRVDAKVSNDVAAAKNIQTLIATDIANGTITPPVTDVTAVSASILGKLDGTVGTTSKAEAIPADIFTYTVDAKGNIVVYVAASAAATTQYQLYPETATSGRSAYATAAK